MGANSVHLIIDPFALTVQFSFYPEGGKLIGDDAKGPTGRVRRGSIVPQCNNFRRSSIFIPFAEGTKSSDGSSFLRGEIRRSTTPLGGDNDPSSVDGVFSQFRHRGFVFGRKCGLKKGNFF
jgi:hypothetical protein